MIGSRFLITWAVIALDLTLRNIFNSVFKHLSKPEIVVVSYIMQEIHEGVCGNHAGNMSLLHNIVQQGYYWPGMVKDAE